MDYKKMYAEKLVSADTAAAAVKSGDWVDYGWTTGTPVGRRTGKAYARAL